MQSSCKQQQLCLTQRKYKKINIKGQEKRACRVWASDIVKVKYDFAEIEVPEWNEECEVLVDDQVVRVTSGPMQKYELEVWSGNHPFYQGKTAKQVVVSTQISKFKDSVAGYIEDADELLNEMDDFDLGV